MVVTKTTYLPTDAELETEELNISSPALKAGATHFGLYCDQQSKEFMLCRAEEQDPRRCLQEGKDVTNCGLEFFRKVKKFCYEPFEKHWHCLENRTPEMSFKPCRKTQMLFDHCVRDHIGQERPRLGHFAEVRIHDSTKRPRPDYIPIREYAEVPKLPKDYPREDPAHGARIWVLP